MRHTGKWTRLSVALSVAALLAGGVAACEPLRQTGDAITKIVAGDEDPIVRTKRALAVAYDTHASATRTVRSLYAAGDVDRGQAEAALRGLTEAKKALDQARLMLALNDLTQGQDALRRAETMLRAVASRLPEVKK